MNRTQHSIGDKKRISPENNASRVHESATHRVPVDSLSLRVVFATFCHLYSKRQIEAKVFPKYLFSSAISFHAGFDSIFRVLCRHAGVIDQSITKLFPDIFGALFFSPRRGRDESGGSSRGIERDRRTKCGTPRHGHSPGALRGRDKTAAAAISIAAPPPYFFPRTCARPRLYSADSSGTFESVAARSLIRSTTQVNSSLRILRLRSRFLAIKVHAN